MSLFSTCTPEELSSQEFVEIFGGIYEHSAWVAKAVYDQGIDAKDNEQEHLHRRMSAVLDNASYDAKMAVILAHPDLAGRAAVAGELTAESTVEQASAGINECNADEFARFTDFNDRYKAKFNFPFIMAVKGANRHLILAAFEQRLENDETTEFETAISEINKIALFRLRDL